MKILIVGNYVNDQQISINRFIGLLEKGLSQIGHQVLRVQAESILGQLQPSADGLGKWLGYVDKLLIFPQKLRQYLDWADLVCICDQGLSYLVPYLKGKTHFVICHDLFAIRSALGEIPENPTSWTGRQYQSLIFNGLKQAQYVACSSKATRADVLRLTNINPQKTEVIEDCLSENYELMKKEEARKRLSRFNIDLDSSLLLHVGGSQWYKNRLGLLKIFKELKGFSVLEKFKLVMVGKALSPEMRQFIQSNNLENYVIELVALPDDDLRAFYSLATALIFPSLQEGFGVPMIEAQSCGCPVFTSQRLPMTEICGEAAVYFDPQDPQAAAAIIADTLLDRDRMAQMKQQGFTNATRFTFQRMIDSYEVLIDKIMGIAGNLENSLKQKTRF